MKTIRNVADNSNFFNISNSLSKYDLLFKCVADVFDEFEKYFTSSELAFLNLKLYPCKDLCLNEADFEVCLSKMDASLSNKSITCQKRDGLIMFSTVSSKLLSQVDSKKLETQNSALELAGNIFGEVEILLIKNDAYQSDSLPIFARIATDKFARLSVTAGMKNAINLSWYGKSLSLNQVIAQCEQAARVGSPSVIVGASGSGKILAAYTIHALKTGIYSPFVILDCSKIAICEFRETLTNAVNSAEGGSLYLKKLTALNKECLLYLIDSVRDFFRVGSLLPQNINFILGLNSVSKCVDDEEIPLLNHLMFYCCQVDMPSLKERWLDVPCMIEDYKSKGYIDSKLTIADESWPVLSDYSWDGNFSQFEAFLVKCSYLCSSGSINLLFLSEYFPQVTGFIRDFNNKQVLENTAEDLLEKSPVVQLVLQKPKQFHPALVRACEYIAKNYSLSFSMTDLAQTSLVSSSHLSAILKKDLGSSFKQLLNEYRVFVAKNTIEENPTCQITSVAQDCGYTDLSHFEKTFKRLVGISPGSYRSLFRETLSTEKNTSIF